MTETKGDLISRSALRDKVFYHDYTPIVVDDTNNAIATEILRLIDNAPAVEVRDGYDLGYIKGLEDGAKRAQLGEVDFKDDILEAYRLITDQEFEHTNSFWITTPKGKKILFKKAETEEG